MLIFKLQIAVKLVDELGCNVLSIQTLNADVCRVLYIHMGVCRHRLSEWKTDGDGQAMTYFCMYYHCIMSMAMLML